MNFLAHYLLAKELESSPLFLMGALLPDIAKRAGFATPDSLFTNELNLTAKIVSGIQFHLKTDKYFHSHNLFKQGIARWKVQLEEQQLGISKSFFLHHLLFEMWLDRILLNKVPGFGIEMYKNLESIDRKIFINFISDFYKDKSGKISIALEDFLSRKFILKYSEDSFLIPIASGVFGYTTKQLLPEQLNDTLFEKLHSMEIYETYFIELWEKFKIDFFENLNR